MVPSLGCEEQSGSGTFPGKVDRDFRAFLARVINSHRRIANARASVIWIQEQSGIRLF